MSAAARLKVAVDPTSSAAVRAAFEGVKRGVVNRVVKEAVAKVARQAAKTARRLAPRGPTDALRQSITTKYATYRQKAVWVYLAGPRRGVAVYDPVSDRRFVPTQYAHLANRGRRAVAPKRKLTLRFFAKGRMTAVFARGARATTGTGFMDRAWAEVRRSRQQIERDILAGIRRVAAQYAARGKTIYTR